MLTFGPVPSRRLGGSLGINNIPPKICSYSCIYCQVGGRDKMQIARQAFYHPKTILTDVKRKISKVMELGKSIDFLAFVPEGESKLDINFGRTIDMLRPLESKIAVISMGLVLKLLHFAGRPDPFIMEIPPCRMPTVRRLSPRFLNLSVLAGRRPLP